MDLVFKKFGRMYVDIRILWWWWWLWREKQMFLRLYPSGTCPFRMMRIWSVPQLPPGPFAYHGVALLVFVEAFTYPESTGDIKSEKMQQAFLWCNGPLEGSISVFFYSFVCKVVKCFVLTCPFFDFHLTFGSGEKMLFCKNKFLWNIDIWSSSDISLICCCWSSSQSPDLGASWYWFL